jgi:hypothetical protein
MLRKPQKDWPWDLQTTHWEDARHWIGVYADLIRFKVGLLERVNRQGQLLLECSARVVFQFSDRRFRRPNG